MKNLKRILLAGVAVIGMVTVTRAVVKYNAALVNETGLAYSKVYPLPLNTNGIDYLSFTATASSVTFATATFTDGQRSTGTIQVVSNTALSTAPASDFLTVLTTQTMPTGSAVTVNGVPLYVGVQWFQDITSTATAISLKQAINANVPGVTASTGGPTGLVFATATVAGSFGNNMTMVSNTSSITVNSANFTGGLDGARLTIGGKSYVAGTDYQVGATTAATALNLATVITASSSTYGVVASTSGFAIVSATSTVIGVNTNYAMFSSTQAALKLGGAVTITNGQGVSAMQGGSGAAYTLINGSATVINVPNHGFTTALPVLYSTASTTIITGLTARTTYFVIPISPNSLSLARTSTGAVAGLAIVLTSSAAASTADSFTLAPLPISGLVSYKWQVSNDCANYYDYNITNATVTLNSYVSTGTVTTWDFGAIDYACVQLNATGPTTGAIKLLVNGNGKNLAQ